MADGYLIEVITPGLSGGSPAFWYAHIPEVSAAREAVRKDRCGCGCSGRGG